MWAVEWCGMAIITTDYWSRGWSISMSRWMTNEEWQWQWQMTNDNDKWQWQWQMTMTNDNDKWQMTMTNDKWQMTMTNNKWQWQMTNDFISLRHLTGYERTLYMHYIQMVGGFCTKLISTGGQHCMAVAAPHTYNITVQIISLRKKFKMYSVQKYTVINYFWLIMYRWMPGHKFMVKDFVVVAVRRQPSY